MENEIVDANRLMHFFFFFFFKACHFETVDPLAIHGISLFFLLEKPQMYYNKRPVQITMAFQMG